MANNLQSAVQKNLPTLVDHTVLSCDLIHSLTYLGVICKNDAQQLQNFLQNGLHVRGAMYLYTVVVPKIGESDNDKFLQALREGNNTRATEFLYDTSTGSLDSKAHAIPKRALEYELERRREVGAKLIWEKPVQQSGGKFNCFCTFIKEAGAHPIIGKATRVGISEAENAAAVEILHQLGIKSDSIFEPILPVRVRQRSIFAPTKQGNTIQLSHVVWYYPNKQIGNGRNKKTFIGYLEDPVKEVAVQQVKKNKEFDFARTEKDFLLKLQHENIVRIFFSELKENHIYTLMELADFNLDTWLNEMPPNAELLKVCTDVMTGLNVLHQKNFVHGNIKPENILIFSNSKAGGLPVAKLSDFGVSMRNTCIDEKGTAKFDIAFTYSPPEYENEAVKWILNPSCDVFSIGLVLAFTMTGKKHIFSWPDDTSPEEIIANIREDRPNWNIIADLKFIGLKNLLQVMLSQDPVKRSEIRILMEHPFFWSVQKSIHFIVTISQDIRKVGSFDTCLTPRYEQFLKQIGLQNWKLRLDAKILNWIGETDDFTYDVRNRRRPSGKSTRNRNSLEQLINLIRNLHQHSYFRSTELEEVLGYNGSKLGSYFTQTFPELTIFLYNILQNPYFRGKATAEFYRNNVSQCFELRQ